MRSQLQHRIKTTPAAQHWEKVGVRSHHGVVIPLFALHSYEMCGTGTFYHLLPVIDWCVSVGMDTIQLLPLNDTGGHPSPYDAISAFALNPAHLALNALPLIDTLPQLKQQLTVFSTQDTPHTRYQFLETYFDLVEDTLLKTAEFQKFLVDSQFWVIDHAAFREMQRERTETHTGLYEEITLPAPPISPEFEDLSQKMKRHILTQFLCDQQMCYVKNYASERGILLMGDIPILIDKTSTDVWCHPSLFHLECTAGAPPDRFNPDGQNWGFPIYNWSQLEQTDYKWWKERLRWASRYYHIYRLDHIVGFFRIWAIPLGGGNRGNFVPKNEVFWLPQGQQILTMMLETTSMLPIGEDLGVIPHGVRETMNTLGICGTKVMRWERDWETDREFIPIDQYPALGLTTVSTHDTETLQEWWKRYPEEARLFAESRGWSYQPNLSRLLLEEILWESHHTSSLFHINPIQEYLSLIPELSWSDPRRNRINWPGTVSPLNWVYRTKTPINFWTQEPALKNAVRYLVDQET